MLNKPRGDAVTRLRETIAEVEKKYILEALKANEWIQAKAARSLGISQRVLSYKIKKYRIKTKIKQRRRER